MPANMLRFRDHEWRGMPIRVDAAFRREYQSGRARIRIAENPHELCEPIVDTADYRIAGDSFYAQNVNPPYYGPAPGALKRVLLRSSVAERLAALNNELEMLGVEIYLFDGYRPQTVQNYFHDEWFPAFLSRARPGSSRERIVTETDHYWSRGVRSYSELRHYVPPHSTGGAVDLTLRFIETREKLEMGTLFDDCSDASAAAYYETEHTDALSITSQEARGNRRFLHHALRSAGFAFHPLEWWHFSFGDQAWGVYSGEPQVPYGYAGRACGEDLPDNTEELP